MNFINCFKCGKRTFSQNRKILANRLILCDSCFKNSEGFTCCYCGLLYLKEHLNKKNNCCLYCVDKDKTVNELRIHNYFFKPYPMFHELRQQVLNNEKRLYLGIQLQIGGVEKAKIVNQFAIKNENKFIYIKSDSTIPQYGCEIVSYPATILYHFSDLSKWKKILKNAKNNNFKSYSIQDCGLHIHVNKNFFTTNEIKKIDRFVNSNQDFFIRVARRKSKFSNYLLKPDELYGEPININRHCALNLCNKNTIEFRMFRGTLNYNSLMAYFQLVYFICLYIKKYDDCNIKGFLQYIDNNNTLFLKKFLTNKIYRCENKWKDLVKKVLKKQ